MYPDYLIHYGVKGMKWGVRKKYYTKGGSYTRKGLTKYADSIDRLNKAKTNYKSNKTRENKQKLKTATYNAKFNKKQLARDYAGDKGKDLYNQGVRISYNKNKHLAIQGLIGLGGSAAAYYLESTGQATTKNLTTISAVAVGASAIDGLFALHDHFRNKNLSAFYTHSGTYK